MADHIQISIEASEPDQDLLISDLSDLPVAGFEQTDTHLLVYFEADSFPSYEVNELLHGFNISTTTVAMQNWNAVWESNFEPVVVNAFCAIRADFHKPIDGVQHEIIITPKMSFGTGHHATTFMMMQKMQQVDFSNKHVFDFGTGTGVLAILAEKLGAASVLAIDNDEWSMENSKENVLRNGCTNIDLQLLSTVPAKRFDIILANINRNVILMHIQALADTISADGLMLLSGLLAADEADIVDACSAHSLYLKDKQERNGWIALVFAKS